RAAARPRSALVLRPWAVSSAPATFEAGTAPTVLPHTAYAERVFGGGSRSEPGGGAPSPEDERQLDRGKQPDSSREARAGAARPTYGVRLLAYYPYPLEVRGVRVQ